MRHRTYSCHNEGAEPYELSPKRPKTSIFSTASLFNRTFRLPSPQFHHAIHIHLFRYLRIKLIHPIFLVVEFEASLPDMEYPSERTSSNLVVC
jgi:hypothetical protein